MRTTVAHARFLFEHDGLNDYLAGFFHAVACRGAPEAVDGIGSEERAEEVGSFIEKLKQSSQFLSVGVVSELERELDELEDLVAGRVWSLAIST